MLVFAFTDMESNLMCPFNESFSCRRKTVVGEVPKACCSLILRLPFESMLLKTEIVLSEELFKPSFLLTHRFEELHLLFAPLQGLQFYH